MAKLRLLHFVLDDKFFYPVKAHFDNDSRLDNYYCLVDSKGGRSLNYIKSQDIICLTSIKKAKSFVRSFDYDVLFFHSLPCKSWGIALEVPKDKKVIWWTWGYDIYTLSYKIKPFLNIDLLLPNTKILFTKRFSLILRLGKTIAERIQSIPYIIKRKRILGRIDYFMPVINTEYQMIRQNSNTKAVEFYYRDSISAPVDGDKRRTTKGDILCGNSATYTNNHLDLIPYLEKGNLNGRTIHLPLSYGVRTYAEELNKHFKVKGASIDFMYDLLPIDEYFKFLDKCSYFICGCIRQQAMGNVYYCLNNHIKVFLFKDSLIYKFLKEAGYAVFEIEKIDSASFNTPLTDIEKEQNVQAYKNDFDRRNAIYESCINGFIKELQ